MFLWIKKKWCLIEIFTYEEWMMFSQYETYFKFITSMLNKYLSTKYILSFLATIYFMFYSFTFYVYSPFLSRHCVYTVNWCTYPTDISSINCSQNIPISCAIIVSHCIQLHSMAIIQIHYFFFYLAKICISYLTWLSHHGIVPIINFKNSILLL